jgi:hypothetical protein
MKKTISIDEVRQGRKLADQQDRAAKNGGTLSSPFSYIILLDESDQSAVTPPTACNRKFVQRHPRD